MKFNKSFWTVQVNVVHNSWNALCAQVKSASYRSWDRKLLVAYRLWGEGLVWLIGVVVCLFPANHCSSCLLMRAMAGCIVRSGIISLCQSAAIFENVKALLATSLSPVRSTKQVQDCFLCGHLLVVKLLGQTSTERLTIAGNGHLPLASDLISPGKRRNPRDSISGSSSQASVHNWFTMPLGLPGMDWGGEWPPQPGMREREYRSLPLPLHSSVVCFWCACSWSVVIDGSVQLAAVCRPAQPSHSACLFCRMCLLFSWNVSNRSAQQSMNRQWQAQIPLCQFT